MFLLPGYFTMVTRIQLILLTFFFIGVPPSHGTLLSNEDSPSLLDSILQVVWEPSSLIRVWAGLDQLYNIVLSWRTVAKRIASLPFGEGRSMDHVKIQEPRHFKYRKPSVASQWDRFNHIYSSSNLSPIVADARNRLLYAQQSTNYLTKHLQTSENHAHKAYQRDPSSAIFQLPPQFVFPPTGEQQLMNYPDFVGLLKIANELQPLLPFYEDPVLVNKLLNWQQLENRRVLQDRFVGQFGGQVVPSLKQQQLVDPGGALSGGPQERLNKFLELLKNLGDMHGNDIRRDSLDTNDV